MAGLRDIRDVFAKMDNSNSNAAAVLQKAKRDRALKILAEEAEESSRFIDSDEEAAEHFATDADHDKAMRAAIASADARRKGMQSSASRFLALADSDNDDDDSDGDANTEDEEFINDDSEDEQCIDVDEQFVNDESSRSIPPSGVLGTPPLPLPPPPPKRRIIESSSSETEDVEESRESPSPPPTPTTPPPKQSKRDRRPAKQRRRQQQPSASPQLLYDEEDAEVAAATPEFTIRDYYCGISGYEHRMSDGSTVRFNLRPRTVPYWRKAMRVPGEDAVKYINTILKKESGPGAFALDKDNMLCREVKVPAMNAICGKGTVTAAAPDGKVYTVDLDGPVKENDLLSFADAGFGRDPMIGVVKIELPSQPLSDTKRAKLWSVYQENELL